MRYDDFYILANQWVRQATDEDRHRYGLDIIHRLYEKSQPFIEEELTNAEKNHLASILKNFENGDAHKVQETLQKLCDSMCEDAVRAVEFDSNITNFLVCLSNWLYYRETGLLESLGSLASTMTNSVDWDVDGDWESETMNNEIERQRRILHGEKP